ncbi:MAG: hypothetical protein ACM3S5_05860 [Rhodospirillales bacterium]
MSYITPTSTELVLWYARTKRVREASGSPTFADQGGAPVRLVDALDLLELESVRYENARCDAEMPERAE